VSCNSHRARPSSDAYLELISAWPLLSLTIEVRRAARRREIGDGIKWKCGGIHEAVVTSRRRAAGHATALDPPQMHNDI
jgi:hypothetical protein